MNDILNNELENNNLINNQNIPNYNLVIEPNNIHNINLLNNNQDNIPNNNYIYNNDTNFSNPNTKNTNQNDNNNEVNNNQNEEEEFNPFNERYVILDQNGNPIIVGGQRLLGMDLIPLIGEEGNEVLDKKGNIMLIGPDGQPKTQDELEPILLDDDKPLVNEENRPILGINGVPLINGYGNPVLGPGELYDKNNQLVIGVRGILPKDNFGNPVKVYLNDNGENQRENHNEEEDHNIIGNNNNDEDDLNNINNMNNNLNIPNNGNMDMNNNNLNNPNHRNIDMNNNNFNIPNNGKMNINNNNLNFHINGNNIINEDENENDNDDNNNDNDGGNNNIGNKKDDNNNIDYNNLKPLIGVNGKPVKDADNNYVLLDENNRPVKNRGITLLLDQTEKPNSKAKPILIDIEGKPINLQENNTNNNKSPNINTIINPDFINPKIPKEQINNNKKPKNKYNNNIPHEQLPFYPKMNSLPKKLDNNRNINKGYYIKKDRKPKVEEKRKEIPKINQNKYNNNFSNNKRPLVIERRVVKDKRDKGRLNYSQCSPDSLKKLSFICHHEYRGACFACDVGCSVSRSGYSPMNYSPYNNLIRRRDITPLRNNERDDYEGQYNIHANKTGIDNDNNYYFTEK